MTRSLDRDSQLSLMLRAGTGDPAGQDLRPLRDALAKSGHVFIIDVLDLIGAELTYFLFPKD